MPANLQRYLPLLLIGAVLLFVLPAVFKKHSSKPSAKTREAQTVEAMHLIDTGEQSFSTAHGRFTSHLADLLAANPRLATDLASGVAVDLDVSTDGRTVFARIASDVVSLVRVRSNRKLTANSCLILKSGSGVKCPPSTST